MKLRSSSKEPTPTDEARWFLERMVDRESGLLVRNTASKGRGVFTTRRFQKGDFLMVYGGELISETEGLEREEEAASGFRYFFDFKGKKLCYDATSEPLQGSDLKLHMGRLVNHGSKAERNAKMLTIEFEGSPHLCIFALRDLNMDEEILYDYGLKESEYPWNKPVSLGSTEGCDVSNEHDTVSGSKKSSNDLLDSNRSGIAHIETAIRKQGSNDASKSTGPQLNNPEFGIENHSKRATGSKSELIVPDMSGNDHEVTEGSKILTGVLLDCQVSETDSVDSDTSKGTSGTSKSTGSQLDNPEFGIDPKRATYSNVSVPILVPDISGNDHRVTESSKTLTETLLDCQVSGTHPANSETLESKIDSNMTPIELMHGECGVVFEPIDSDDNEPDLHLSVVEAISAILTADSSGAVQTNDPQSPHYVKKSSGTVSHKPIPSAEVPFKETGNSPLTSRDISNDLDSISQSERVEVALNHSDDPLSDSDTVVPDSDTELPFSMPIQIPNMSNARATLKRQCSKTVCDNSKSTPEDHQSNRNNLKDLHGVDDHRESSDDDGCDAIQSYPGSDDDDATYIPDLEDDSSDDDNVPQTNKPAKNVADSTTSPASSQSEVQSNTVSSSTSRVVVMTTSNEPGKRSWDKPQYCPFCLTPQMKLPRHLKCKHESEIKVQIWLTTKDEKEKSRLLTLMRNFGNYLHNDSVLREGKGTLIVVYRPQYTIADPNDYLPCHECYGYYAKSEMWKHACPSHESRKNLDDDEPQKKRKRGTHCKKGKNLLPPVPGVSSKTSTILLNMSNDSVAQYCRSDTLIRLYADKLTGKHGHDADQTSYIRQKVRELGRLMLEYRSVTGQNNAQLSDILCPAKFNDVILATKQTAGFNADTHLYNTPSLALKIGHGLKTCSEILRGKGLVDGDECLVRHCKGFIQLYDLHWEDRISHHAHRSLSEGRRNNPKILPMTEDVVKLTKHLQNEVKERKQNLLSAVSTNDLGNVSHLWVGLAEVLLTQLVVFNRKRPGEVSKMTLDDYRKCSSGEDSIVDSALSKWEVALCKCLWRVEIVGKRLKTVVVLLTVRMKEAMDTLVENREVAGVQSNQYLFSNLSGNGHLRATDVIREHSKLCEAKHPENLRATRLRKHIATVSQIMNLQDNELDILANFLGHDVRTHRQYYRLPESTIQVAKVSKVLLKIERGELKGLAGKSLEDVQLDPSEECVDDVDVSTEESDGDLSETEQSVDAAATTPGCSHSATNQGRRKHAADVVVSAEESDSDHSETGQCVDAAAPTPGCSHSTTNQGKRNVPPGTRKPWTTREKSAVAKHLRRHLISRKLPGKADIMPLLEAEGNIFRGRSWRNIKDFVRNQIRKTNPMSFIEN